MSSSSAPSPSASSSPDPLGGTSTGVPTAAILPLVLANVILLGALVGLFVLCCRQNTLPSFRSKVPHLDREGLRPADPRMLDPVRRYSRRGRSQRRARGNHHDDLSLPNDTPTLPRYTTLTGSLMRSLSRLATFGRSPTHATLATGVDHQPVLAAAAEVEAGNAPEYRTLDQATEQHLAVALSTPLPTASGTHGRDTLRSTDSLPQLPTCDRPTRHGQVAHHLTHIPPPLAPPPPPASAQAPAAIQAVAFPTLSHSASAGVSLVPIGARPQLSTITERDEDTVSLFPQVPRSVPTSPTRVAPASLEATLYSSDTLLPMDRQGVAGEHAGGDDLPSLALRMLTEGQLPSAALVSGNSNHG